MWVSLILVFKSRNQQENPIFLKWSICSVGEVDILCTAFLGVPVTVVMNCIADSSTAIPTMVMIVSTQTQRYTETPAKIITVSVHHQRSGEDEVAISVNEKHFANQLLPDDW